MKLIKNVSINFIIYNGIQNMLIQKMWLNVTDNLYVVEISLSNS